MQKQNIGFAMNSKLALAGVFGLAASAAADGKCKKNADQAVWNQKGKAKFQEDVSKCAHQCFGYGPQCPFYCIKDNEGYSEDCSSCFKDLISCRINTCGNPCNYGNMGNSAACKSCVDQKCTPTFKTCSGLTPPSQLVVTTAASNACAGDADQAIWNHQGKSNFQDDLNKCGHSCFGGASCVAKCMKGKEGYSDGCSNCFGELVGCTNKNCLTKCIGGNSPACKSCVNQHCTPTFETCSGLTPPSQALPSNLASSACTDDADQAVWNKQGKANFQDDLSKCGHSCFGGASCVSKCMKGKEGYSDSCSSCFGYLVGCTNHNCLTKCIGGNS